MVDCTHLEKCPFFNDRMQSMPATADIDKKGIAEESFPIARDSEFQKFWERKNFLLTCSRISRTAQAK